MSSPDTCTSLAENSETKEPNKTVWRNTTIFIIFKDTPAPCQDECTRHASALCCLNSLRSLLPSCSKRRLQPPNPAQTGPAETDLHVHTAQGVFVQPNLRCAMCDFFPCCRTRVISRLCHFKSQKSQGVKAESAWWELSSLPHRRGLPVSC